MSMLWTPSAYDLDVLEPFTELLTVDTEQENIHEPAIKEQNFE